MLIEMAKSAAPDFSALAAWSTLGSAVVTAATAVLIYLQIRQTRRSVNATESAVGAAQDQAAAAQRSIDEAQKALISSQIPKLTVRVREQPSEVWLYEEPASGPALSMTRIDPGSTTWTTPGDNSKRLALRYVIEVANDGPGRADVEVTYDVGTSRRTESRVLLVGETQSFDVTRVETVEEWIRLYRRYDPQRTSDEGETGREIFRLFYSYNADFGSNEGHPVMSGGSILERVPGNDSGWTTRELRPTDPAYPLASAQPFERFYYRSKLANERLE